jgi:hypothetical protein
MAGNTIDCVFQNDGENQDGRQTKNNHNYLVRRKRRNKRSRTTEGFFEKILNILNSKDDGEIYLTSYKSQKHRSIDR